MALSLLCSRTGGEILGAEAVRKSFPDYWDRLRSLGIPVTLEP
jgi:3-phosphoshikimate 1-carboxyvinyltransferase